MRNIILAFLSCVIFASVVTAGDIKCRGFGEYEISKKDLFVKFSADKSYGWSQHQRKIEVIYDKPSRPHIEFASVSGYGKKDKFIKNAQRLIEQRGGDAYLIINTTDKGDGYFEFAGRAIKYTDADTKSN